MPLIIADRVLESSTTTGTGVFTLAGIGFQQFADGLALEAAFNYPCDLAMSPDGQSIVTGAGDETLRFWNVFPGPRSGPSAGLRMSPSTLIPSGRDTR